MRCGEFLAGDLVLGQDLRHLGDGVVRSGEDGLVWTVDGR
jgi:hypothetical protein